MQNKIEKFDNKEIDTEQKVDNATEPLEDEKLGDVSGGAIVRPSDSAALVTMK